MSSALLVLMTDSIGDLTILHLFPGTLIGLGALSEHMLLELVDGCDNDDQYEVYNKTD